MKKGVFFLLLILCILYSQADSGYKALAKVTLQEKIPQQQAEFFQLSDSSPVIQSSIPEKLAQQEKIRVIVMLKDRAPNTKIKASASPTVIHKFSRAYSADISHEEYQQLQHDPNIEKIYEERIGYVLMNSSNGIIRADLAWPIAHSGTNITGLYETVCILDTGVDDSHEFLDDRILAQHCYCSVSDEGSGGCCPNNQIEDTDADDDHSHGTHVAGTVASTSKTFSGVAFGAKLVIVKVCNSSGACAEADYAKAAKWCTNHSEEYNISVISMSIGDGAEDNSSYCDSFLGAAMLNNATANGIFVSVASGNDYYTGYISYPACASNVTSVGATQDSDTMAPFTNRNQLLDLLAPGVDIWSAYPCSLAGDCGVKTWVQSKEGTSMATPHVAGAAALVKQAARLYNDTNLTPFQIRDILNVTGAEIEDAGSGLSFPRIDIYSAVQSVLETRVTDCIDINISGTYAMYEDILGSSSSRCINISAGNTTFDCQGHKIQGDGAAEYGIYIYSSGSRDTNITIRNCTLERWERSAVYIRQSHGNTIAGLNATSNTGDGLYLDTSSNNTIVDSAFRSNQKGIHIYLAKNNTVRSSRLINNTVYGLLINQSSENHIADLTIKNSSRADLYIRTAAKSDCNNIVDNITGTKDKPIAYINDTVAVEGWDNVSYIIFCNANYSTISNLTIDNLPFGNNMLLIERSYNMILESVNLTGLYSGVYMYQSRNITINDSFISNSSSSGIYYFESVNNTLSSCTIRNNRYGVSMEKESGSGSIYGNTITKNTIVSSTDFGISILSDYNRIFDNLFNNTQNYNLSQAYFNYWNTTNQTGPNIIGGVRIGGNYWAYPNATGISESCKDPEKDSLCDDLLNLSLNNTDYLPLHFVDNSSPLYFSNMTNGLFNSNINFTANITFLDDRNLDYIWFESNHTGSMVNYSFVNASAPSYSFNQSYNITISKGKTFQCRFHSNDTYNNLNSTVWESIAVRNAVPVISEIADITVNETNNVSITVTASDSDQEALTYGINDSHFSQDDNLFVWETNLSEEGIYHVMLNVTDSTDAGNRTVIVTVLNAQDLDNDGSPDFNDTDDDNDGLDDNSDTLHGNASTLNTTLPLNIFVNGSANITRVLNGTLSVNLTDYRNNTIVIFSWNFSNSSLVLNWTVDYAPENGTILIQHLNTLSQNTTKTVLINRSDSNFNHVCIADYNVGSLDDISSDCSGSNESRVPCTGSLGQYSCTLIGTRFEITGLNHSGVRGIYVAPEGGDDGGTGGGGGGGGGGGAAVKTATSETVKIGRINSGQAALAEFTAEDLLITGIEISVKRTVTASSVTAHNTGDDPGVAEPIGDIDVVAYLRITLAKISSSNMQQALVRFRIPKSEGYDPATVELRRFDGNWTSLPTQLKSQDSDSYYFESEVPEFSIFAIVGKRLEQELVQEATAEVQQEQTGEDQPADIAEDKEEESFQEAVPYADKPVLSAIAFVVLVVMAAIVFIMVKLFRKEL